MRDPSKHLRHPTRYFQKRIFDLSVIFLFSPIWLFCMLVTGLLVYLNLGRPVLFCQRRPGLHGKVFELLKFRTMTDEKDEHGNLLLDSARLRPFGRWLRSISFDELPEFLNVVKGDMSLVGPRPLLMEYLTRYTPEQARRHETLPGLTGWAQIHGRNCLTWEERFKLDVWYVDNHSFWLDCRIFLVTVVAVLRRSGISAEGHATMPKFETSKFDMKA